jgi:CPA1 family monovalent cation:H+ antiporter
MLDIAAICLVVTALLAYLNHRFVGLPTAIGVMATAMAFSLALVGLDLAGFGHGLRQYEESLLRSIDFFGCADAGHVVAVAFLPGRCTSI